MIASSGALVLTLAACGEDSPTVEAPSTDTTAGQTSTDEAPVTDDAAGTDDAPATDDAAGTDDAPATDDASGDAGGEAAAGTEVSTEDFIAQLKSPGMENMSSFTMDMDMQMEGQAVTMTGKADLSGEGGPVMDMQMEMPGMGNIHMIMVDGQAYMSMPGLTEEGKFIQMPLDELMGEDADSFTNQVDMTSQWDDWEAGAQKITFVGAEDVDGESLNHYTMLIDTSALDSEDMADMPDELTYDVWRDDQNFMLQVSFDVAGAESVMKMDNWGEPVDIVAPDASQITEMPGMPTSP